MQKQKQLNHHATILLTQYHYGSAIIYVVIHENYLSIDQISKDVTEVLQGCRNPSIGKFFVSGIVYCPKVRYETIQSLNESLYEECMKYDVCFIDNGALWRKTYGRMEYI